MYFHVYVYFSAYYDFIQWSGIGTLKCNASDEKRKSNYYVTCWMIKLYYKFHVVKGILKGRFCF